MDVATIDPPGEVTSVRDVTNREKLLIIQEVQKRPSLWDVKEKSHSCDPKEIMNEWSEIRDVVSAESRPMSILVIQTAWKNLKDTHIKVKQKWERKNLAIISTGCEEVGNKWKFWDAMEFMRDVPVLPRSRKRIKQLSNNDHDSWLNHIPFPLNPEVSSSAFLQFKEESTSSLVLAFTQTACESLAQNMGTNSTSEESINWENESRQDLYGSLNMTDHEAISSYPSIKEESKIWNEDESQSNVTASHEIDIVRDSTADTLTRSVSDMYKSLKSNFPRQAAEFRKKINDLIYEYDLFLAENLLINK